MVDRIVQRFQPDRVILFGSHARGDAGPDSDVDLLVVMPVRGSVRRRRIEVRVALRGSGAPKDILVSKPDEFERLKGIIGTIENVAACEGEVLYERNKRRSRTTRPSGDIRMTASPFPLPRPAAPCVWRSACAQRCAGTCRRSR
jgi:predicted nucleotidyltransferase